MSKGRNDSPTGGGPSRRAATPLSWNHCGRAVDFIGDLFTETEEWIE